MKKILLTGMSGVGKSTYLARLAAPECLTIEWDDDGWLTYSAETEDYLVNTEKMRRYLNLYRNQTLIFAGTAVNQKELYPDFNLIIGLYAPLEVMYARIKKRTTNSFGKTPTEWAKIKADTKMIESRLLASCDVILSTNRPTALVLDELKQLIFS